MTLPWHPYFCEENAYRICEVLAGTADCTQAGMLFIFSEDDFVAVRHQRVASPDRLVYWDYHVVAVCLGGEGVRVYDPDSRLGLGVSLSTYLTRCFDAEGHALFRLLPWSRAQWEFSSDRRHMRRPDGSWLRPPPPWPPIIRSERGEEPHRLAEFLATGSNRRGPALTAMELAASAGRLLASEDSD